MRFALALLLTALIASAACAAPPLNGGAPGDVFAAPQMGSPVCDGQLTLEMFSVTEMGAAQGFSQHATKPGERVEEVSAHRCGAVALPEPDPRRQAAQ